MIKILKVKSYYLPEIKKISEEQFGVLGWAPDFFETELNLPLHYFYIAISPKTKEVLGFINFMQTEGDLGLDFNILNVAVRQEYKRKGVACALLNFVFKKAKKHQLKSVWLEVRKGNFGAIKLYEKLGFKLLYVRKNYYSNFDDALIYRKIF